MSTTREDLRIAASRLIGELAWSGTMTGGSTTTIVHTGNGGLRDAGMSPFFFAGNYLLLSSSTDDGNWRMIREGTTGYAPNTGTITVGEAWTTGGASSTTYEIHRYLDPAEWNTCINNALAKMRYRFRSPITLVTDGDMETSGTTDWTASSSTLTKLTTGSFIDGAQALRVANSGANGYGRTAAIAVNPGDSYHVWADYLSVVSTAAIIAWDATNSEAIVTSSDAGDNPEGGMITIAFNIPSTCYSIQIRLRGTSATADIYWDNLILMRVGRKIYNVPTWLTDRDQFVTVVRRHGNRVFEYNWVDQEGPIDLREEQSAVTAFRIVLPSGTPYPLFIVGDRAYASLATDAATTSAQLEWASYAVASEALEYYTSRTGNQSQVRLVSEKLRINNRLDLLNKRLMPRRPHRIDKQIEWVATGGRGLF